jgi:hypothetical protein
MTGAPVGDPLADHLLTPQNAALLLSDYQPAQLAGVRSMDRTHLALARLIGRQALTGLTLAHGYDTAFWWTAGIFTGALLRRAAGSAGHALPGTWQGVNRTSHGRPRPVRHDPAGRNQHMHGCPREIGPAVLRSPESP